MTSPSLPPEQPPQQPSSPGQPPQQPSSSGQPPQQPSSSGQPPQQPYPAGQPQQPYPVEQPSHQVYQAYSPGQPHQPHPAAPAKGVWLGVLALVLGILGCALPLAPFDLTGVRGYLPWIFGLPGLIAGAVGCVGPRRGKPLAISGIVFSAIALVLGFGSFTSSLLN